MIDLDEFKSRINPAYQNTKGTESHERKTLCDEIESLRQQLAEKDADIERLYKVIDDNWASRKQIVVGQLRERQLLKALDSVPIKYHADISGRPCSCSVCESNRIIEETLSLPQYATALQSLVAKAGEVMRERCISAAPWPHDAATIRGEIRALPAIILDDLKGGAA